jgi:hypothetical protein
MDWDAQAIRLYMDDRLLNETAVSDTIDASRHRDPFNAAHYMLLNLAIGGTNGGDPSYHVPGEVRGRLRSGVRKTMTVRAPAELKFGPTTARLRLRA